MKITQNSINGYPNNSNKQPNFTARNKIVRDLGDIAMLARREFPMVSDSMIYEKGIKNDAAWKVYRYVSGLVSEIRGYSSQQKTTQKIVLSMFDAVKQLKIGNCRESAYVANVACRINGFKSATTYELSAYNRKTKRIRDLGHSLVGINMEKSGVLKPSNADYTVYIPTNKSFIIDNWLGKTDYGKNMNYKVHPFFATKIDANEVICYVKSGYSNNLTADDIIYIEKLYSGLSKSQRIGLLKRIKYMLMDKKQYEFKPFETDIKESYRTNLEFKNSMSRENLTAYLTQKAQRKK